MYNISELNSRADLKQLYEQVTGRNLHRHSDQWEGYCPICHEGTDRFYISDRIPHKWFCRQCNPTGGSPIDFVSGVFNLPDRGTGLKETAEKLAELLNISEADAQYTTAPTQHKDNEQVTEYVPVLPDVPSQEWQQEVKQAVMRAHEYLFSSSARLQLEYLKSRGLTEKTIHDYYIGYNPQPYNLNVTVMDRVTHDLKPVTCWDGFLFPCYAQIQSTDDMNIIRVKVRMTDSKYKYLLNRHELNPTQYKKPQKYWFIAGGKPVSLFCAKYALKYPNIIYVEGEFDAMTINQTAGDICKAVTFGAHGYIGNAESWQAWYRSPENTVICFDNDPDSTTADAVRSDERKLKWEIVKAQTQDAPDIRGNAPVIRHLPEQYHDWNDILKLPNGVQIIRNKLTEWFM